MIYKFRTYITLSVFLLFGSTQHCWSQSFLKNDSIHCHVLRKSTVIKSEDSIEPVRYLVRVQITRSQRDSCRVISNKRWIELLNDTTTDWAANLLLYDLFDKDAIHYSNNIRNRNDWVTKGQAEDLEYWKAKFK